MRCQDRTQGSSAPTPKMDTTPATQPKQSQPKHGGPWLVDGTAQGPRRYTQSGMISRVHARALGPTRRADHTTQINTKPGAMRTRRKGRKIAPPTHPSKRKNAARNCEKKKKKNTALSTDTETATARHSDPWCTHLRGKVLRERVRADEDLGVPLDPPGLGVSRDHGGDDVAYRTDGEGVHGRTR